MYRIATVETDNITETLRRLTPTHDGLRIEAPGMAGGSLPLPPHFVIPIPHNVNQFAVVRERPGSASRKVRRAIDGAVLSLVQGKPWKEVGWYRPVSP